MLYHWLRERPEVLTGRLVLPPLGAGRTARRPEPLRGGTGGLPDRSGGRRLRLPVRDRPPSSWPATSATRAVSPPCGGSRRSSRRCASPRAPARAPRAGPTTPAMAGAWRPSSSPGCRWTGPIPSASSGTAKRRWPRGSRAPPEPGARAFQGRAGTGCRCRCPRPSASGRRPAPERGLARSPPGAQVRSRPPVRAACWPCPSAPSSSTARTCRWTPIPASPRRGGRARRHPPRRAGGARVALWRQR